MWNSRNTLFIQEARIQKNIYTVQYTHTTHTVYIYNIYVWRWRWNLFIILFLYDDGTLTTRPWRWDLDDETLYDIDVRRCIHDDETFLFFYFYYNIFKENIYVCDFFILFLFFHACVFLCCVGMCIFFFHGNYDEGKLISLRRATKNRIKMRAKKRKSP